MAVERGRGVEGHDHLVGRGHRRDDGGCGEGEARRRGEARLRPERHEVVRQTGVAGVAHDDNVDARRQVNGAA